MAVTAAVTAGAVLTTAAIAALATGAAGLVRRTGALAGALGALALALAAATLAARLARRTGTLAGTGGALARAPVSATLAAGLGGLGATAARAVHAVTVRSARAVRRSDERPGVSAGLASRRSAGQERNQTKGCGTESKQKRGSRHGSTPVVGSSGHRLRWHQRE